MTTEPTMNPEANADDIDVEMTMEEAMALEAAQLPRPTRRLPPNPARCSSP